MNIVESLRKESVENLFNMRTFNESFESWSPKIERLIGNNPNFVNLLNLGDKLSEIFKSTGESGRSQSSVAGGGSAWEGLVCWYLNLCLIGSRTVVIKHSKRLIPECVVNAITVNYGSFISNTESDLIAITFPNLDEFKSEYENDNLKHDLDELSEKYFEKLEVSVIQCKTNWNDNAQIPMLWEIVYSSTGFQNRNITIGRSGYSMKDLQKFTYSFVTVPSNNNDYNANSLAVKRVYNLSGGNYWGKSSISGIANSLKEMFNRNFNSGWNNNSQRNDVNNELEVFNEKYNYFNLSL